MAAPWPWGTAALGQGPLRLDSSALPALPALLPASLKASARETQSPVERDSGPSEPAGNWLTWTEVSVLASDWLILVQMRTPKPCCWIDSRSTVLTGRNGAALIVVEDADGDVAAQL